MRLTSFLFALLLIGAAAQAADTVPAEGVTPTQCGPADSGAPCDGSGPASLGNSSDTDQGAGNPINVITGNKYQREVDLPALPGVLGLEIVRHYNSSQSDPRTPPGITGRGWRLSYETDLYPIGNTLQIVQADGTRIIFVRNPSNPSQCASNNPAHGRLAITRTPRGEEYVWTWTNGRTLSFNPQGKLTQIKAPTGEFVSLTRDTAGALVKVTDPQGRSLVLGYPAQRDPNRFNGVTHIESPVGRFGYAYGSAVPKGHTGNPRNLLANLVRVDLPGKISRHYHYEDPSHATLLTGISVAGQSAKPQRISTWAYDKQGRGILSVKGLPRQIGKDGKPVPGTGIEQVNLNFAPGKTTLTNSLGQTTTYKHAIVGNEHRLLDVRGAGCASCGEANVRYGYDRLGRLIAETRLNDQGQPLSTTKTERDAQGRAVSVSTIAYANGNPQPGKLQVRYEYAGETSQPSLIARPSVIPGREHQIRISTNTIGQPTQVTESGFSPLDDKGQVNPTPISRTTTYAYQTINGRSVLAQIDGPLPNGKTHSPVDSDITRLEWDTRGKLVAVVSPGNLKSPVRYDEAGRIAAVGQSPWPTLMTLPKARADRLAAQTMEFDSLARPVAWQSGGATVLKAGWGEPGTAAQFRMLSMAGAAGQVQRRVDDFGRVVAIHNPGMGWQTAVYDAAGRLVRIADPRGAVQVAQYDFANRLLRLDRHRPGQTSPEETITLRWQGRHKTEAAVADAEGVRRTLWQHDAQGRLIEETQVIALKNRSPVRFSVRRQWNETGERIELADALKTHSTLIQTRDAQGRIGAMRLDGALPSWLGGGRSLVKQIGWAKVADTPFAERIVYGDGRTDRWPLASNRPATSHAVAFTQSAPGETGLLRPGDSHDIAGLPAAIDTEAGRLVLNWDAAGRLAKISQGETSERFVYDAQGRRIAKIIGSHIRYFAYDGIQLAGEADQSGKLLTRYAYLGYRPIAQIVAPRGAWQRFMAWLSGPGARTYSTSKAGRVLAMHDSDGRTIWQDAETPGVRRVSLTKTLHQPLRDVGQYADDESGLIYHMARFFDPRSGFFLSPDPKGVADAVENTRPDLLLNPYAYAGGNPDEFFDPDGAAKIRYYAITSGDLGGKKGYGSLGQTQGFTNARWAFVIYDIQGGGDTNTELGKLRNQYAATNTGLLFDGKGNFIGSANDPLTGVTNPTKTAIKQEGGISALSKAFVDHYAGNIIGIPQFDVEFDDDNATKLIWYLMGKEEDRKNCKSSAPGWLPEIRFAAEEAPIKVTSAAYGDASKQRILACGEGADGNLDQRRISKYEAAAEINETARINRDCSKDGCPGIGYYCDASKCYSPRDQLTYGPPKTTEPVYTPSYGRSQFIGTTLVGELIDGYTSFSAADKAALGLTPAMKKSLEDGLERGKKAGEWFDGIKAQATYADANNAWNKLSVTDQKNFTKETGLGEREYTDMARMKTQPPKNSKGDDLSGDARAAFATAAIMSDAALQAYLMGIFKDFDKFTIMAKALMNKNMNAALASKTWDKSEEHLAAMVARAHNGGVWDRALSSLKASDSYDYVKRFLGVHKNEGDWYSLRCTESFGPNTIKPGTQGKGIGGLQMTPLVLN